MQENNNTDRSLADNFFQSCYYDNVGHTRRGCGKDRLTAILQSVFLDCVTKLYEVLQSK